MGGGVQNYAPSLGPLTTTASSRTPTKRGHNFENPPYLKLSAQEPVAVRRLLMAENLLGLGFGV